RAIGQRANLCDVKPKQVDKFLSGTGPLTATWHVKHQALRGFYCYVKSHSYVKKLPLPTVIPKRPPPFVPYIYTRQELRSLLDASLTYQKNRGRLEPYMVRTLLLLLYGAGLRIKEAISLTLADANLVHALLTIRETKFRKTRLVPLGRQLTHALSQYVDRRQREGYPQNPDAPFFISRNGKPVNQYTIEKAFQLIREKAGIYRTDKASYQPRLHDLRHTFAVHRLTTWYKQGADVQKLLPVLSVYLGHHLLAATSVYLTMTPSLLHQANLRFEKYVLQEDSHA
ncbi:tyrosine-type recombinase/integrase, partial [Patescibacteria group bacterium]|nr:tyrosine-type recombinase/integrase [Patescibacteria group bacterium]